MRGFNRITVTAVAIAAVLSSHTLVFGAASFSDVPTTHWAYSAITELAEKGIMVGDSTGNYNPDQLLDKFYTAKILAKVAGFKYVGLTTEESLYISRAYSANKSILDQFSTTFQKWDQTADKEVAYLLEKGILTVTDLNKFVVKMNDNTEKLHALTREQYCVFLVKLMEKGNEALSTNYNGAFNDDGNITAECRPYVYYLKNLGVISGDSEGKFNPRAGVTKAMMAVMTEKVTTIMAAMQATENTQNKQPAIDSGNTTPTITPPAEGTTNDGTTTITSISGTLYKIYTTLNAVQIKNNAGTLSTYKMEPSAVIYIDGALRTIQDLSEGMTVSGVLSNQALIELRAQSVSVGIITNSPANKQLVKIEGTIAELMDAEAAQAVTIKVRAISPKGVVTTTDKVYSLDKNCTIKRDGTVVAFSDMQTGEVIYAGVTGNVVYTIELEQRDVAISNGILKAKRYETSISKPVLTIEDEKGKSYEFIVTNDSYMRRMEEGRCKWNELKIGDRIELKATYTNIDELYATGERSSATGWVSQVNISATGSTITIREDEDENSLKTTYVVGNTNIDLYDITLESKVKLRLDSLEVEDIYVLKRANTKSDTMTGYLYVVKGTYIGIAEALDSKDYEKVYIDKDTNFVDAVKGRTIDRYDLEENMEIYVTIRIEDGDRYAKSVTVIAY